MIDKSYLSRMKRKLKRGQKNHEKAAEIAIKTVALYVQAESQKLVPVDTGNLRNSAAVRVKGKGFKTEARVVYTASYAIYVHENLHSYHKPPTRAKFLESVYLSKAKQINRVAQAAFTRVVNGS